MKHSNHIACLLALLGAVGCRTSSNKNAEEAAAPAEPKWEIVGGYTDEAYAEQIKKNETAFLERNAKLNGVEQIESGLQYRVVRKGTGRRVMDADRVKIHYIVSELHGLRLEDSRPLSGRQAVELDVNQLNHGWQEVVPLMREGSIWRLFVPRELVRGSVRTTNAISKQALIYDVEIVEVMLSVEDWYSAGGKRIRSSLEENKLPPEPEPEAEASSEPEPDEDSEEPAPSDT